MRTTRVPFVVAACVLAIAACGDPASRPGSLSGIAQEVVGGSTDLGHEPVVMVYKEAEGSMCSGTLISDRVFLAAAHCITSTNPADYRILGGHDVVNMPAEWGADVVEVHAHPDYASLPTTNEHDVSVIILAEDSPVGSYRWHADDTTTSLYQLGTPFTLVGWGRTSAGVNDAGVRRQVDLTINDLQGPELVGFGGPTANGCNGDSGAPMLADIGGYLTVIGVVSYGDSNCDEYGAAMRTDYNRAFIEQYALPDEGGPTPTPGGGDDDDDGVTPGDDDDAEPGSDSPFGCSVATPATGRGAAFGILAVFSLAVAFRRR